MTNEELLAIAEKEHEANAQFKHRIHICAGTGCVSSRSEDILTALDKAVQERGLTGQIQVKKVGCMGLCAAGPIISILPDHILYKEVTVDDVPAILDSLDGEPIAEKVIPTNLPFFYRQEKNALEHSGIVNPDRIEDYIAEDGYTALVKALTEMSPDQVIKEVLDSGLRGRGGGGYSSGLKWGTVAKATGDLKYVICNADEGDPGAFMDRSMLESSPHTVLEGMAIAAYAVGASEGVVYVRAEYPLAIKRLRTAIRQAERMGLLGNSICGTPFKFKVELRLGAGAFVCGEETALMRSVEGNRGMPRTRPPYPAQSGLWGRPTLINNVETFANIPTIINNGGKWFARIGTERSKGTKVFALTGKIEHTGLIEVPMGITLREIVYDIGGGIPNGRKFKAIQTGGPSGGCIPEECLDTPVDYESLKQLGSMMGSGGMIVIDDTSNMVDVARYFMEFSKEESCGKCIPCRAGTSQMYELLCKFSAGEATEFDLKLLEQLCDLVRSTSLCGLGQAAPNPVISTLRYFRHEYMEKIRREEPHNGSDPALREHKEVAA
jgi:bidirectional [NiFe] hydrogenase diaphorase subunit